MPNSIQNTAYDSIDINLFNLHFFWLKHTCISWRTHTFVLINAILALAVLTEIAGTVIFIDLTVHP